MHTASRMTSREVFLHFSEDRAFALSDGQAIYPGQLFADLTRTIKFLHQAEGDVLITCRGRYEFSVALLASWISEKSVILPPNSHQVTLDHICAQHKSTIKLEDRFTESENSSDHKGKQKAFKICLNNIQQAVTIYTSGSSGKPKAVLKSIGDLFAEVFALKETLVWPDKPLVASVPPHHLYGLTFSILLPWALGIPIVDECPMQAEEVANTIIQTNAGTLISVPVHLHALIEQSICREPLMVISSAGPLNRFIAEQWYEKSDREIDEVYGSTETGIIAYRRQLNEESWTVFPGVRINSNQEGLLQVSSPFINRSEGKPFQTQDLISMRGKSGFLLHGRVDSIVKIAGKRVSLLAIEEALKECEGIFDAAVTAVPVRGHIRDIAIWAAVATDQGNRLDARSIRMQLLPLLEGIEIPRRIIVLKKLPREENGKLRLKQLMTLFEKDPQR